MRRDRYKYVWRKDGEKLDEYLFDLAVDPGEAKNLLTSQPAHTDRLKAALAKWEQEMKRSSREFVARTRQ